MRCGEVAKELKVPERRIRRLVSLGIIPAKRLPRKGSRWQISQADLPRIRQTLIDAGDLDEPPKKK